MLPMFIRNVREKELHTGHRSTLRSTARNRVYATSPARAAPGADSGCAELGRNGRSSWVRMIGGVLHIAEAGTGVETERDEGKSQIVRVEAASLVGTARRASFRSNRQVATRSIRAPPDVMKGDAMVRSPTKRSTASVVREAA
jgi:hypothetical protein